MRWQFIFMELNPVLYYFVILKNRMWDVSMKDTESQYQRLKNRTDRPILTMEKLSKSLYDNEILTLKYGRDDIEAILHFYGAREIFLLFYDSKTLNMS